MKALGIAAAAAIAFAPLSAVATTPGVAQAAPCAGAGANPRACESCLYLVARYGIPTPRSCYEGAVFPPTQAPPSTVLVQAPPVPPPQAVPPSPAPPSAVPVQTPAINPLPPGAPRNAAVVTPPKGLDASPQAIAAAKAAPLARINPAAPPKPPTQADFNHQVQDVINAHSGNVDVVRAENQTLARPRHWDYVDYDEYHRPSLYNPLSQAMTFRYFYDGAYREVYLPAGGRIVLDAAAAMLFPFTAVGDSAVASGSFYGGAWVPPDGWSGPPPPGYTPPAPPAVYHDVSAYVPAANRAVQLGQVTVVGRDNSQSPGSQDTFLLDDSTMAWGQINDDSSNSQIRVTKTQSLPGVGPIDDGSFLVALAGREEPVQREPTPPAPSWWPMALGYGVFGIVVGLVAWMITRQKREQS